jgi:hypothetical protein
LSLAAPGDLGVEFKAALDASLHRDSPLGASRSPQWGTPEWGDSPYGVWPLASAGGFNWGARCWGSESLPAIQTHRMGPAWLESLVPTLGAQSHWPASFTQTLRASDIYADATPCGSSADVTEPWPVIICSVGHHDAAGDRRGEGIENDSIR